MEKQTRTEKKGDKLAFYTYTGKRKVKATDSEIKKFIKDNHELIDKSKLSPEYAKYLGAVKGGHKRSSNTLRTDTGTLMSSKQQEQLIKLYERATNSGVVNIDIKKVAQLKGYEDIVPYLIDNPTAKKDIDKAISIGVTISKNSTTAPKAIRNFEGKIFVNGKEITQLGAVRKVNAVFKELRRQFGKLDASTVFRYKGVKELHINTPPLELIRESKSIKDFAKKYSKYNKKEQVQEYKSEQVSRARQEYNDEYEGEPDAPTFADYYADEYGGDVDDFEDYDDIDDDDYEEWYEDEYSNDWEIYGS